MRSYIIVRRLWYWVRKPYMHANQGLRIIGWRLVRSCIKKTGKIFSQNFECNTKIGLKVLNWIRAPAFTCTCRFSNTQCILNLNSSNHFFQLMSTITHFYGILLFSMLQSWKSFSSASLAPEFSWNLNLIDTPSFPNTVFQGTATNTRLTDFFLYEQRLFNWILESHQIPLGHCESEYHRRRIHATIYHLAR